MTLTLFCAFQPALIFWCTVPRYSLAHRRFFTLSVQSLEKKDTSCLTEVTSLPKPPKDINENAGAVFLVFCFFLIHSGNTYLHFTETMWMLSVGLTTGADSWAVALKVNCERLWQETEKTAKQPVLHFKTKKKKTLFEVLVTSANKSV